MRCNYPSLMGQSSYLHSRFCRWPNAVATAPDASQASRGTFEASRRTNSGVSPRDIEVVTVFDTPVVALSVTGDLGVSVVVFVTEACRKPPLAFCFRRRARPKTPARKSTSRRACLAE